MTRQKDELYILIRSCGPVIKDAKPCLDKLEKRFDAVEDYHRDLEVRRRAFKCGFMLGIAFGIISVLWLIKTLFFIS